MLKLLTECLLTLAMLTAGVLIVVIGIISLILAFDGQTCYNYTTSTTFYIIILLSKIICGGLAGAFGMIGITDCWRAYRKRTFRISRN